MKKRILSLLLSLAVALSALPAAGLAAAEESVSAPLPAVQTDPAPEAASPRNDACYSLESDAAAPARTEAKQGGAYYSLDKDAALDALRQVMDGIAATYVNNSGEWAVMDMAAYEDLFPSSPYKLTTDARQAYINHAAGALSAADPAPDSNAYAKAVLSLSALGYDPAKLYPVNSNTPIDAGAGLRRAAAQIGYYSYAPWALLAGLHRCAALDAGQAGALAALLRESQGDNGLLSYEWGGYRYADPDTTGSSISALARLYGKNDDATAVIDRAIPALSAEQKDSGSIGDFGNACTDAYVIIGLAAMGVDPRADSRFVKNGKSLLDGLFKDFNPATNAFQMSNYSTGVMEDNALATEQAFRALIAAYRVMQTGQAFNIYDFTHNASLAPAHATGEGTVSSPEEPTGDDITVTVTIKGLRGDYWLRDKAVSIPGANAKVYHALTAALQGTSITQEGAESGYLRSMTKGRQTLGEFTHGENSGWLYKVNGALPGAGLTQCPVSDGDSVLWYYTEDWTQDPDAGSYDDPAPAAPQPPVPVPVSSFTDVDGQSYYYDALVWAVGAGITNGTSGDTFSPDAPCTRAQMMTFLWRAAGCPEPENASNSFLDVDGDAYYLKALLWAVERGVTNGTGAGRFSPDAPCTRAQMAAFLYRFAGSPAESGGNLFTEVTEDDYYYIPVSWAYREGITNGTSATTYGPADPCTRAQMVTFLYRFLAE